MRLTGFGYTLDETEMNGIVQTLLGADILQDPQGLRMCVELSEREIGEAIPASSGGWADDTDERGQLRELVGRLMWRDAAMWVFVETIQDLYGSCPLLESIRTAVRSILAEPILSRGERQAIHQMCADLVCSDVASAHQPARGFRPC